MFKPPSTVDWFYMESCINTPRTTTQEMLEMGRANGRKRRTTTKKQFNFQTLHFEADPIKPQIVMPLTTSYKRDYTAPYDQICPSRPHKENIPNYLWNRKPMNDFALERITSSEFMFMDDHLIDITPERRRINYFRQLRNQHYPLV